MTQASDSLKFIFGTHEPDSQDNPCRVLTLDISGLIFNQTLRISGPNVLDCTVFPIWGVGWGSSFLDRLPGKEKASAALVPSLGPLPCPQEESVSSLGLYSIPRYRGGGPPSLLSSFL